MYVEYSRITSRKIRGKTETIDGVHTGWGCVALRFFVISSNPNKQLSSKIKCLFSFVFNQGSNIF